MVNNIQTVSFRIFVAPSSPLSEADLLSNERRHMMVASVGGVGDEATLMIDGCMPQIC